MAHVCSSCGHVLPPPEDANSAVKQPDAGEEPENYHFDLVETDKGDRFKCIETGSFANPIPEEEYDGTPQGGTSFGSEPQGPSEEGPYDIEPEKNQRDILKETIENPRFELSDAHIAEVLDWADSLGGALPPAELEGILSRMSGISKQRSELIRKKYEAKLNHLIRSRTEANESPPLGVVGGSRVPSSGGGQLPSGNTQRTRNPNPQPDPTPAEKAKRRTVDRRERRVQRRQDALDTMAEEMAEEIMGEVGALAGDMRSIMTTLLRAKAQKDPDWFFEKAEGIGVNPIDVLAEPSDAMRDNQQQGSDQFQVDQELDDALSRVKEDKRKEEPQQTTEQEPVPDEPEEQLEEETNPLEQMVEEGKVDKEEDEEEEFEEIFGQTE